MKREDDAGKQREVETKSRSRQGILSCICFGGQGAPLLPRALWSPSLDSVTRDVPFSNLRPECLVSETPKHPNCYSRTMMRLHFGYSQHCW